MALLKLFLVALVTTAALWTAAEAYVVDEVKTSRPSKHAELNASPCEPPTDGHWDVTDGLLGSPVYHFDMSSAGNTYTGSGYSTVAYPPFPEVPLTLSAVFDETACTFTGNIALPSTNTVVYFVWSVDSKILMTGTGRRFVDGVLESILNQTAKHAY